MENHYLHTGIRMPRILLPRHGGNHHGDWWYGAAMASRKILKRMSLLLLLIGWGTAALLAQSTVSGTVIDADGEPLIGVNVQVKDANQGTATDFDGRFLLDEVAKDAILIISYVGYKTQEVNVKEQEEISIIMISDSQLLDEVVVVGYGTQKKVNLTGAITAIKSEELTGIATPNLSNTLAGRAPGVNVTGTSGLAGASSSIRIRGGFGDPLYVIDGIVRDKEAFDALEANEVDQLSCKR